MSRVAEALERASTEGAQSVSDRSRLPKLTVGEPVKVEETPIGNASSSVNGEARSVDAVDLKAEPALALGKKIQRLIFGRGLDKVKEFPLVFQEKKSFAGEQYKILREQIKKIYDKETNHCLAVMSPVKGDGKSTVAANLAAVIALDHEQQVLLIDADLRSPSIHKFFGLNSTPGLADYLSSSVRTSIMQYVHNTSLQGLRVIPAGRPTHLSSELLAAERMNTLLEEIPMTFPGHQVIIDTSPVLSTSDPLVLAQQVKKIVMVVRAGTTPRECLSEAIKSLGPDRIKGIILNGATVTPSSKYYYYYGQQA
jgi:capsular exopolysaccharide synthesis family protein